MNVHAYLELLCIDFLDHGALARRPEWLANSNSSIGGTTRVRRNLALTSNILSPSG